VWVLARNHVHDYRTPASAYVVVASLFDRADPNSESALSARRLLSEGCSRFPEFIADQYRSWGLADDASRAETRCHSQPALLGR
jgi:hypothetical protein